MGHLIGGIVVVVALVVIAAVALWMQSLRNPADAEADRVRHPSHEFHVVEGELHIVFDVPLAEGGADPVLRDLLFRHAVELIRDRKRRSQPLQGFDVARVFAKLGGTDVEVGTVDLSDPDGLPEIDLPNLLALGASPDDDPFRHLGELDEKQVVPSAADLDHLAPVGEDLRLTAGIAAGLRLLGVQPERMTVTELGLGLLQLAGYTITRREGETYVVAGGGSSTYVSFVSHEPGTHPELSEKAIAKFLVGFATARTDRGLLITDKFGAYSIYEKERSNPLCHFIPRERLQAFVDSIATRS